MHKRTPCHLQYIAPLEFIETFAEPNDQYNENDYPLDQYGKLNCDWLPQLVDLPKVGYLCTLIG